MRLNPDCLRDILLYAEESAEYSCPWLVCEPLPAELTPYVFGEIAYHIRQCISAGWLYPGDDFIDGSFEILSVSPAGHRAIEAIRNPAIHEKAKIEWPSLVLRELVSSSVSGFVSVAMEIAQSALHG